jgi:DNA polymerase-3 subunit chi
MTEVAFYHLETVPLERALPKLLEKTLEAGKRALILAGSDEHVEFLNVQLWTYEPDSWLPHGSKRDGNPENQPVWISTSGEKNPNNAHFLFLTDGASSEHLNEFERCFEVFDGRDIISVEAARIRWKAYLNAGHKLTYWHQNEMGSWKKKEI